MGEGTMANYTGKILWHNPRNSAAIVTRIVNGASELKAGYVCTATGETEPDVAKPSADTHETYGMCLDLPNVDIDTAFDDNEHIQVAIKGGGAGCWGYVDDNTGAVVIGQALYNTGADNDGFLEQYTAISAAPTTYDDSTVDGLFDAAEVYQYRYVGRAWENQADQGSTDVPIKVLLCA